MCFIINIFDDAQVRFITDLVVTTVRHYMFVTQNDP